MATHKKASKLNTKLYAPVSISICPKRAGVDMCDTIETKAADNSASFIVCVRQRALASRRYGLQVQRRWKYVRPDGTSDGYTEWQNVKAFTLSKNARKFNCGAGKPFTASQTTVGTSSKVAPGYWLTPNIGASSKTEYLTVFKRNGDSKLVVNQKYGKIVYQFRARAYDGATATHSEWLTKTLTVKRKSVVSAQTVYVAANAGGLLFTLDATKNLGAKSVTFTSIKDSDGKELLRERPLAVTAKSDTHTPASGKSAWAFRIPASKLKRKVGFGAKIHVEASFRNGVGASTQLNKTWRTVDSELNAPNVRMLADIGIGAFRIVAARTDADDNIGKASCCVTYTAPNGKQKLLKATNVSKNIKGTYGAANKPPFAVWEYRNAPLGAEVTATVTIEHARTDTGGHSASKSIKKTLVSKSFILTGVTNPKVIASVWANPSVSDSGSGRISVDDVLGGELPFAVTSTARRRKIVLKGTVLVADTMDTTATVAKWRNVMENPGIYTYRDPFGEVCNVAVSDVKIDRENDRCAKISVTMEEVRP